MPPEPPITPPARPRPGVDGRRRALGLEPAPPSAPGAAASPLRESLAASLARIPDLDPTEPPVDLAAPAAPTTATASPAARVAPVPPAAPREPATSVRASTPPVVRSADESAASPIAAPAAAPGLAAPAAAASAPLVAPVAPAAAGVSSTPPAPVADLAPSPVQQKGRRAIAPPARPPWWRRVAFGLALAVFVAAIPALVVTGWRLIEDSKAGTFDPTSVGPTDPGFEAQVDPTPTALAISSDDEGVPTSLAFFALSGANGGGSVILIPLDTAVADPQYGIGNIRLAWEATPIDQPELGRQRLTTQVAQRLNAGVGETMSLTNASWEQLVAPVSPLRIDNPDAVDLGFGITIPSGETELPAELVGQYLQARLPNESDIARLVRHEVVWSAWLDQVAEAGRDDAVPGETSAGIGRFVRALAAGPHTVQTLPVEQSEEVSNLYEADESAISALITDAVASPTPAIPGSRFTVRLLNGVSADAIPSEVVRDIVRRGGAVTILGNGPEFDTDETTVVFANDAMEDVAEVVATTLGATGDVRLDREAPDTVDLTIVLGRDILGDASGTGDPGATTPETLGEN